MRIPSTKVDQLIFFLAVNSGDFKTRLTGLTSFTVYRSRNGAAPVLYTTPTVAELSAANMPGVYSLAIDEDTTIAAGSDSEEYCVHITQASMAPVTRTIELYRRTVTTGETVTVSAGAVSTVTTTTTATNVTTVNGLAAAVITAASIAADAITDEKVAADVTIASVTGAVGSVTGAVGSVTGSVGSVTGAVGSVTAGVTVAAGGIASTSFAAGAIDAAALAADAIGASEFAQAAADKVFSASGATLAELAQAIPSATPRPDQALMLMYMTLRNASKSTATERRVVNDAGTVIAKATMSDDGTTFDQGELVAGP